LEPFERLEPLEPVCLLKLAAKDAPLAARFLHRNFHIANVRRGKLPADSLLNLLSDIFRQKLRAGVGEGK
jgi:hypothetical protein